MPKIIDLSQYEGKAIMLTNKESQVSNELYQSQIVVIPISMDMFHPMGQGNFYPNKGLTNTIGHGAGIEYLPAIRMNDVYGDETIHGDGSKTRKVVGKECVKQGQKMKPDGTWTKSSPCIYEFNFMDRAELDIMGMNNPTPLQKRKKILDLKKFSSQRASTGAELMVIRELLGAKTAFKKAEIETGQIVVSRIERSDNLQKALAHAEVENVRTGGLIADRVNQTAGLLTGETIDASVDFQNHFDRPVDPDNSGNNDQSDNPDQRNGFESENSEEPKTPKEEYEQFCIDNNISDDWKTQIEPTLDGQDYSKESVDWAIGEMQQRL